MPQFQLLLSCTECTFLLPLNVNCVSEPSHLLVGFLKALVPNRSSWVLPALVFPHLSDGRKLWVDPGNLCLLGCLRLRSCKFLWFPDWPGIPVLPRDLPFFWGLCLILQSGCLVVSSVLGFQYLPFTKKKKKKKTTYIQGHWKKTESISGMDTLNFLFLTLAAHLQVYLCLYPCCLSSFPPHWKRFMVSTLRWNSSLVLWIPTLQPPQVTLSINNLFSFSWIFNLFSYWFSIGF